MQLTDSDYELLLLIDGFEVYWNKRDGGSEIYQKNRPRINELMAEMLVRYNKQSCEARMYELTQRGQEVLKAWKK